MIAAAMWRVWNSSALRGFAAGLREFGLWDGWIDLDFLCARQAGAVLPVEDRRG